MQRTINNGTTVFTADVGMLLTDGESFVSTVILGKEADGAEWYEITAEEADKRMNGDDATEEDYQSALREMGVNV